MESCTGSITASARKNRHRHRISTSTTIREARIMAECPEKDMAWRNSSGEKDPITANTIREKDSKEEKDRKEENAADREIDRKKTDTIVVNIAATKPPNPGSKPE